MLYILWDKILGHPYVGDEVVFHISQLVTMLPWTREAAAEGVISVCKGLQIARNNASSALMTRPAVTLTSPGRR